MTDVETDRQCPNCGARESGDYFFYFDMIEVRGEYDGALILRCPTCAHMWPRFDPPGRLNRRAAEIITDWKKGTDETAS